MSFNRHHHHQPQPYVEEEYRTEVFEGERVYAPPPPTYAAYDRVRVPSPPVYASSGCAYDRVSGDRYSQGYTGGSNYKRNERLGELGAVAAGAFTLYEGHKVKTDPAHAAKHKLEEEAAALGAVGSTGYAYYEHREKEKFEDGRW